MSKILQVDSLILLRFYFHLGQVSRCPCAMAEVFLLPDNGRRKIQSLCTLDASLGFRPKTITSNTLDSRHRVYWYMLLLVLVWILSCLADLARLAYQNRLRFGQSHYYNATSCPNYAITLGHANGFARRDRIFPPTSATYNYGRGLPRMA